MAIMRWDPFGEVTKMQRDMDRIFSRMGTSQGQSGGQTPWMPRINIKQQGSDLVVEAELAGIQPQDVDIQVTDGVLTVSGERKMENEREEEGGWMIRESGYGAFERSIVLPEGVDPNSISADFKDGMLQIMVPKGMEFSKPQTTKIAIGGVTGGEQGQQGQITQGQQQGQQQGQTQGQTQGQQGSRWGQTSESQKWQQAEGETGRQQEQGGQAQVEQGWVTGQGQQQQGEAGKTEAERERERQTVGAGAHGRESR